VLLLLMVLLQGLAATYATGAIPGITSKYSHVVWGFLATIVTLFAHTITMFYFIGTGVAVKDEARKNASLLPLYERTRKFKARTSGSLTLAPLLIIAASVVGAGTAGGSISPSVHLWMELVAVGFNVWTLMRVTGVIGENMLLMEEANRLAT
jgi:hypothetical protein